MLSLSHLQAVFGVINQSASGWIDKVLNPVSSHPGLLGAHNCQNRTSGFCCHNKTVFLLGQARGFPQHWEMWLNFVGHICLPRWVELELACLNLATMESNSDQARERAQDVWMCFIGNSTTYLLTSSCPSAQNKAAFIHTSSQPRHPTAKRPGLVMQPGDTAPPKLQNHSLRNVNNRPWIFDLTCYVCRTGGLNLTVVSESSGESPSVGGRPDPPGLLASGAAAERTEEGHRPGWGWVYQEPEIPATPGGFGNGDSRPLDLPLGQLRSACLCDMRKEIIFLYLSMHYLSDSF